MSKSTFVKSNENASLLVLPVTRNAICSTIFRTYTILDFADINYIQECQEKELFVNKIDFDTVLSNFNGITFFMIFRKNRKYLDLI